MASRNIYYTSIMSDCSLFVALIVLSLQIELDMHEKNTQWLDLSQISLLKSWIACVHEPVTNNQRQSVNYLPFPCDDSHSGQVYI